MRSVQGEMTKKEWPEPHIPVESSKLWLRYPGPTVPENLDRSRQRRGEELLDDYFVHNSAFPDTYFRRRFRMERHLFNRIMTDVCNHDSYFVQMKDASGAMVLLPKQKITAALRDACVWSICRPSG